MNFKTVYKNLIGITICFLIALALYPNASLNKDKYSTEGLELNFSVSDTDNYLALNTNNKSLERPEELTLSLGKSFEGFKEAIAFKESRGNYFVVNTLGYLGKYQFGKSTLKGLGIKDMNKYLKTPEWQEKAFIAYLKRNKAILSKYIQKYDGKTIGGINVTESGMLAAAHLSGAGNVIKFLKSNGTRNAKDAYGSTAAFYMKKFAGYDVSFIKAERLAKVNLK